MYRGPATGNNKNKSSFIYDQGLKKSTDGTKATSSILVIPKDPEWHIIRIDVELTSRYMPDITEEYLMQHPGTLKVEISPFQARGRDSDMEEELGDFE